MGVARGSVLELQTQLVMAAELNFGKTVHRQAADTLAEETGKMLWALQKKI